MTNEQARALRSIAKTIIEACAVAKPFGAPGGHIYAALMGQGCSLNQYQQIMAGLENAGMLDREGECYKATAKGCTFAGVQS